MTARQHPVLHFQDIELVYRATPPVIGLYPFTLSIGRGEYVTVIGPSGSGKSSFLNVAGLLDRPTGGSYRLDGIDTGGLNERDRTALRGRRIGFVFQAFNLMAHRSALENVMLSLLYTGVPHKIRRSQATDMLHQVGLGHRVNSRTSQMSGGERQRVAIARALVNRPSLLLCDEPTGNLDSTSAGAVLELIDALNAEGFTIVVVTHDQAVAARGDRRLVIKDGHLTEIASPGTAQPLAFPASRVPGSE